VQEVSKTPSKIAENNCHSPEMSERSLCSESHLGKIPFSQIYHQAQFNKQNPGLLRSRLTIVPSSNGCTAQNFGCFQEKCAPPHSVAFFSSPLVFILLLFPYHCGKALASVLLPLPANSNREVIDNDALDRASAIDGGRVGVPGD
jgi:hypothetical protein